MEETGIGVEDLRYLGAFPNTYVYRGLSRPVCDVFFAARAEQPGIRLSQDEAEAHQWLLPADINPDELAFDSMRQALEILRGG